MKENKRIAIAEAISHIKDGDTIMVGGFMANGTPEALIDALVDKGTKDLTLICMMLVLLIAVLEKWWLIINSKPFMQHILD
ncbi:acetate CoA-transferase alpha subunit [Streptococcus pyogenes]|nr:acetate CoA-transferase alpha subunit [Streptococcus pyogenes]